MTKCNEHVYQAQASKRQSAKNVLWLIKKMQRFGEVGEKDYLKHIDFSVMINSKFENRFSLAYKI